jgi:hypothetical protein
MFHSPNMQGSTPKHLWSVGSMSVWPDGLGECFMDPMAHHTETHKTNTKIITNWRCIQASNKNHRNMDNNEVPYRLPDAHMGCPTCPRPKTATTGSNNYLPTLGVYLDHRDITSVQWRIRQAPYRFAGLAPPPNFPPWSTNTIALVEIDNVEYSLVKDTSVSMHLRIILVAITNTNNHCPPVGARET